MKFHSIHRFVPAWAGFVVLLSPASGANLYWDASTVTVNGQSGGGTGTWNPGSGGWEDGAGAVNWTNADNAIFGGTAGTVTLGGNVSAGLVTIQTSGYGFAKNTRNLTIGSLAGTGNATFSGTGTLAITGSSSGYSGTVTLGPSSNAGTTDIVTIGASDSLGTGTINMRGAQLQASTSGITIANAVSVAAGGFRLGGTNDFSFSGTITVDNTSRTFANYGTGIVTLANIDTSAGANVRVAFDNGQLATPGGLIIVAGTVSGPGQIESTYATSNTRLSGANTHTGQTLVSAGTLTLANALAAQNSTVNLTGGNLVFDSSVSGNAFTFGGLTGSANLALQNNALTPAAVALTVGGNNSATSYTGVLSGPGSLTKTGTGNLTLGGSSVNVAGGIDVTGGRITLSREGQINLNSTDIALGTNREMVIAYGTGTLGGSITMGAGSLLSIQNGNPVGNQALRSTVNTNIVLASGSGSANAASIGGFIFGNSTVLTGTISGSGDLRWRNGILGGDYNSATISAANNSSGWAVNSYTGATSFEGVNLTFSLASNANNDVVNPFGASANAVSITGGQLHFLQTGQANNTTIIENNLSLSAANAATTTFFREDGNLRLAGSVAITTTGTGNVRLQSQWGAANFKGLTLAGQLTGSGNLTITRSGSEEGSVRLANNSNTYNGTITVNNAGGGAGILVLEANGAATSAKVNLASSGAHLNINTANATIAELTGVTGSQVSARSAGQTLTVNQSTDTTFAGALGGTGIAGSNAGLAFVKDGGGTLTLSGTSTHTGDTTVSGGTLLVTGSIGSSVVTVNNAGTVLASGTSGTIGKGVTVNNGAILAAGGQNDTGTAAVGSSGLSFATGSIFEWDLAASKNADGAGGDDGVGGTDFDSLSVAGTLAAPTTGAIFKVVFGASVLADITDTGNVFWNTPHGTQQWSMAAIFGKAFDTHAFSSVATSSDVSAYGSFTVTGSTLTWTAVPEPTSALAGLLILGGLLRRKRS